MAFFEPFLYMMRGEAGLAIIYKRQVRSGDALMRMSKAELLKLLATGDYYAVQRKDDWNREDIRIKREDGLAAEIQNYPYRINQMPAYLFDELVRKGALRQDRIDENGGAVFRFSPARRKSLTRAA